MSKATKSFNEWYGNKPVPARVMSALMDEAYKLDKGFYDSVTWEYRNDILCDIEYARTLAAFIEEHEDFMKQIKKVG